MSEDDKAPGAVAFRWWARNIADRETSAARALAARLRRAHPVAALCEPAVLDLARDLSLGPADVERLLRLVTLLAEVRRNDGAPLAARLGAGGPVLSRLRFQRLMRAEGEELTAQLRRAIGMAERSCNVTALARDCLYWTDKTRARWCFQYFGAHAPNGFSEETIA